MSTAFKDRVLPQRAPRAAGNPVCACGCERRTNAPESKYLPDHHMRPKKPNPDMGMQMRSKCIFTGCDFSIEASATDAIEQFRAHREQAHPHRV